MADEIFKSEISSAEWDHAMRGGLHAWEIPNKNLLDNWYFADPIDQRQGYVVPPNTNYYDAIGSSTIVGQTTTWLAALPIEGKTSRSITVDGTVYYVSANDVVRGYVGSGYTVDRWKHGTYGLVTIVNEDSIKVINTGAERAWFHQYTEYDFSTFAGKSLTGSVLLKDGTLYTATGVAPAEKPTATATVTTAKTNFGYVNSAYSASVGVYYLAIGIEPSHEVELFVPKLEPGSTQTLARQDSDGNWVLIDPPPNPQQELAKCQRYQMNLALMGDIGHSDYGCIGIGVVTSSTKARIVIPIPVALRATPTIEWTETLYIVSSETWGMAQKKVTSLSVLRRTQNTVTVEVVVNGELTPQSAVMLIFRGHSNFIINANP